MRRGPDQLERRRLLGTGLVFRPLDVQCRPAAGRRQRCAPLDAQLAQERGEEPVDPVELAPSSPLPGPLGPRQFAGRVAAADGLQRQERIRACGSESRAGNPPPPAPASTDPPRRSGRPGREPSTSPRRTAKDRERGTSWTPGRRSRPETLSPMTKTVKNAACDLPLHVKTASGRRTERRVAGLAGEW